MKTADHKNTDPRLAETKRLMMFQNFILDASQSKNCPQADHTLLLNTVKLPTRSRVDHRVFRALAHRGSLLAKQLKLLFLLHPNLCLHVPIRPCGNGGHIKK